MAPFSYTLAHRARFIALLFAFSLLCLAALALCPQPAYAAKDVHLQDGQTVDVSSIRSATRLHADTAGTVYLTGSSKRTMLFADPQPGVVVNIVLDGLTLKPDSSAPGALAADRSAIKIGNKGGTVNLISQGGTTTMLVSDGAVSAIRKDGTKTQLNFTTTDFGNPGTIEAHADSKAYRTSAIGCWSPWASFIGAQTFGNVDFQGGVVKAYGSRGTTGGPGIGADANGSVNGVTFSGADVTAVAGDSSCAAIGTSNSKCPVIFPDESASDYFHGASCQHITITDGSVTATHYKQTDDDGGAGIGGGNGTGANTITITGGTVVAHGSKTGAGIGGGQNGDGLNIVISGGTVEADGGSTGIGGGYAEGMFDGSEYLRFGDATVFISGGNVTAKATIAGPGIGTWKGERGAAEIVITGGNVTATGAYDGAGIGSGRMGTVQRLIISGGTVTATGGDEALGIGTGVTGQYATTCDKLNITGGTVTATGGKNENADIGGYLIGNKKKIDVYISGGNVRASKGIFGTAWNKRNGVKVYLNKIALETYDRKATSASPIGVKQLAAQVSGSDYSYGTDDMNIFTDDTELWLWLPQSASVASTSFDAPYIWGQQTYRFTGATTSNTGGSGTLYPVMRVNLQGGTGSTLGSAVLSMGEKSASEVFNSTRPGYTLTGYSVENGSAITVMNPDGSFDANASDCTDAQGRWTGTTKDRYTKGMNLYAQWTPIHYSVGFDANVPGGSSSKVAGTMQDMSNLAYDTDYTLEQNAFVLNGYTFAGWNTQANGKGVSYADGATVKNLMAQDKGRTVLYAQWKPKTYQVTFQNGNGSATGTMAAQTLTWDTPAALNACAFSLAGKTFTGWSCTAWGSRIADGATVCNLGALDSQGDPTPVTLTAAWTDNNVTMITVTNDDAPVSGLASAISLRAQSGTVFGHGQFTEEAGTGSYSITNIPAGIYSVVIDGYDTTGKQIMVASDRAALATVAYCTVSIAGDDHGTSWVGKTGTTEMADVLVGSQLAIGTTVDSGYVFDGYSAQFIDPTWGPAGAAAANQTVTVAGKTIIEGHTRAAVYTAVFNANGGTGTMESQDMVYDEPQNLFACGFGRAGYTFAGWTLTPEWTGTLYADGQSVQGLSTVDAGTFTLYAQWSPIGYLISFDDNGSMGTMADERGFYDIPCQLTANEFERASWHFAGWNTNSLGTGTAYADEAEVTNLVDANFKGQTLYATWTRDTYTIRYDANGGTGIIADQTALSDMDQQLAAVTFERSGYVPAGWNTAADGSGTSYADGEVVYNLANTGEAITLYAQWKAGESGSDTGNQPPAAEGNAAQTTAETGDTAPVASVVLLAAFAGALACLARIAARRHRPCGGGIQPDAGPVRGA